MGFNSAPTKLKEVHKEMVSKRRAIACNKHVNDNLKRWEAAAGTPTTVIIKITQE
jgi:hypothetical protein